MIGHLRGRLLEKKPNQVLIDVNGIGYEVQIPLTSFYDLPGEGNEVSLKIHTHLREDALILYGFGTRPEKELFLKLIGISGVGPRLAIAILSGARAEELARAIVDADLARLTCIPGVGRKTAERVILELKGHMAPFLLQEHTEARAGGKSDELQEDVISALLNLGYARAGAERALSGVVRDGDTSGTFEDLLRHTLRRLAG